MTGSTPGQGLITRFMSIFLHPLGHQVDRTCMRRTVIESARDPRRMHGHAGQLGGVEQAGRTDRAAGVVPGGDRIGCGGQLGGEEALDLLGVQERRP